MKAKSYCVEILIEWFVITHAMQFLKRIYLAGRRFVRTVGRLMERLLEYRSVIRDENSEYRMSCTVNLLVRISAMVQISTLSSNS